MDAIWVGLPLLGLAGSGMALAPGVCVLYTCTLLHIGASGQEAADNIVHNNAYIHLMVTTLPYNIQIRIMVCFLQFHSST